LRKVRALNHLRFIKTVLFGTGISGAILLYLHDNENLLLLGAKYSICLMMTCCAFIQLVLSPVIRSTNFRAISRFYFYMLALVILTAIVPSRFSSFTWRQFDQALVTFETPVQMRGHSTLGRVLTGSQKLRFVSSDNDFILTTDSDGNRTMPGYSALQQTRILFLGSSWTMGIGVNDAESFAYQTAELLGPSFIVKNIAHPSWGLEEHLTRFMLAFQKDSIKPDLIYTEWLPTYRDMIADNQLFNNRGFLIPASLNQIQKTRLAPEFERQTYKMMNDLSREKGTHLVVLLLSRRGNDFTLPDGRYREMKHFLDSEHISYLDLGDLENSHPFIHDTHPGKEWHAAAAIKVFAHVKTIASLLKKPD